MKKFYILFLVLTLSQIAFSEEYNLSCIFTPKIELKNISLDLFGLGSYFPDLVETNDAFYKVKLTTIGNWSQHEHDIQHRTIVKCDDEERRVSIDFRANSYRLLNGTIMTDFLVDEGRFYVPEGKKHCYIILTKIYAINRTWEKESGCNWNVNNNCYCIVNGLSGNSANLGKEVLTKEQFFAKRQTQISWESNLITLILGLIGSLTGIFGLYLHWKNSRKKNSK